jgi:hypothetical protein
VESTSLKPGDRLTVNVELQSLKLPELHDLQLALQIDRGILSLKQGEELPVRTRSLLAPGATWKTEFELGIDPKQGPVPEVRLGLFVSSREFPYIPVSKPLALSVLPRPASVSGKVIDALGKGLAARVGISKGLGSLEVETDEAGRFAFDGLEGGVYSLKVLRAPKGFRQVSPTTPGYSVDLAGIDAVRDFLFAGPDHVPPEISQEIPFAEVVATGCLYGIACDDVFGTGVKEVSVCVGKDGDGASWTKAEILVPAADFLSDIDARLAPLPPARRAEERAKLEAVIARLGTRPAMAWMHVLDGASRPEGGEVVRAKAADGAGNEAYAATADVDLSARFDATPASGPAPLEVKFTDRSIGPVAERLWDFGDGARSLARDPVHTYTRPGIYTVTLEVESPDGYDMRRQPALAPTAVKARGR